MPSLPLTTKHTHVFVRLLTLSTYGHAPVLGSVYRQNKEAIWMPSPLGKAAAEALETLQQKTPFAAIQEYAVMPNHIHILFYAVRNPDSMRDRFMTHCLRRISRHMAALNPALPLWEPAYHYRPIGCEHTQPALADYLRNHHASWQSDPL